MNNLLCDIWFWIRVNLFYFPLAILYITLFSLWGLLKNVFYSLRDWISPYDRVMLNYRKKLGLKSQKLEIDVLPSDVLNKDRAVLDEYYRSSIPCIIHFEPNGEAEEVENLFNDLVEKLGVSKDQAVPALNIGF